MTTRGNQPPTETITARTTRRTTPETIQAIITRYQAGTTIPTIARDLGVATDTVRRHLKLNGVRLRDDRNGKGAQAAADRIAALGTNTRTIRNWARTHGIRVPPTGQVPTRAIDAYAHAQEGNTP